MPKENGNPKILAAGAAVHLLTGIPAAWGVFQKPVMEQYGFCLLYTSRELGWEAEYGIDEMCRDSWNWQSHNPDGYKTAE